MRCPLAVKSKPTTLDKICAILVTSNKKPNVMAYKKNSLCKREWLNNLNIPTSSDGIKKFPVLTRTGNLILLLIRLDK